MTHTDEILDNTVISLADFLKQFDAKPSSEEKLKYAIDYMRRCLEDKGGPHFREFWESRKSCLELFKEPLPHGLRTGLWKDYIDLTREGRQLKSLIDEESAFAVEQIELAVTALEHEIEAWQGHPSSILTKASPVELPQIKGIADHREEYLRIQQMIEVLTIYASKVHAMRKELVGQEMRIRQKNQFFTRLSSLGDKIFPERRQLIGELSERFRNDVSSFVEEHFSPKTFSQEKARRGVFFFREEIKAFQAIAKILTLNTQIFTTTREQLSGCWDKLKGIEKELKKEMAIHKAKSGENAKLVEEKFEAFKTETREKVLSPDVALGLLNEIAHFMRGIDLVRGDVLRLKEELGTLRASYFEQKDKVEKEKKKQALEIEASRRTEIESFKTKVVNFAENLKSLAIDTAQEKWNVIKNEFSELKINKIEKQSIERELKRVRDQLADREEEALISLSGEDKKVLSTLEEFLQTKKERRGEIKKGVEEIRKMVGSSGFDFEKAMTLSTQLEEEKERLEKIDESILEIQEKIREIKRKHS
ncbi:MAG: hypothetical protein KDK55_05300 [Chlamydiia bacterium]|nr:hypothetical protein [Chlamydiia bacterium]